MPRQYIPLSERFWAKVDTSGDCWIWTGSRNPLGYGRLRVHPTPKRELAHRVSWMLHYGDIPNDLCVLHRCDNPSCVRPEHLFLGTRIDNNADALAKNRFAKGERSGMRTHPRMHHMKGERNPIAKLTSDDVRFIRDAYDSGRMTTRELASKFGLTPEHTWRVARRRAWKHLE